MWTASEQPNSEGPNELFEVLGNELRPCDRDDPGRASGYVSVQERIALSGEEDPYEMD